MKYKILNLTEILNDFKKENSGIIIGNGFCSWLYHGRDEVVRNKFKNWNLKEIINVSSDLFFKETNQDITNILEKCGNNVDEIFFCIKENLNQDVANKWLIFFFKGTFI